MDQFFKDVQYGIRSLIKSPGFALATILTLGLGIGANTAIFSLISGVLLKPLPYANADRLVLVQQSMPQAGRPTSASPLKSCTTIASRRRSLMNSSSSIRCRSIC